jgi:quinol monooxygenase YgiN
LNIRNDQAPHGAEGGDVLKKILLFVVLALFAAGALIGRGVAPTRAAATEESITIIATVYVTPGREDEFVARNVKLVAYVHKEEPNTIYRLHRSKKDPTVYVYYEHYPSQAALDYHSKTVLPAFNKEFPRPEGLLARPIEGEKYQLVFD